MLPFPRAGVEPTTVTFIVRRSATNKMQKRKKNQSTHSRIYVYRRLVESTVLNPQLSSLMNLKIIYAFVFRMHCVSENK